MAIYRIQAPDGAIIRIEGPENASQAQLGEAVNAYIKAAGVPTEIPKEPTIGEQIQGIGSAIKESFTGAGRETRATQELPEMISPGDSGGVLSGLDIPAAKKATMAAALVTALDPMEAANIVRSAAPDIVGIQQDEKGNIILANNQTGAKVVVNQPGLSKMDLLQGLGLAAAFTPAARAAGIITPAAQAALTQTAIEASQAAAGGEFNPADIAISGALGGAVPAVVQGVRAVGAPAKQLLTDIKTAVREPVQQAIPTQAAPDVYDLARRASGEGIGAVKAQEDLAALAKFNPEAAAEAERLGFDLPTDVFSDSTQFQRAAGLTRSVIGSEGEEGFKKAVQGAADRASELMATLDASPNIAAISDKIKGSLGQARTDLAENAEKIYKQVEMDVKPESLVRLDSLSKTLDQITTEVGASGLSSQEQKLLSMLNEDGITYGRLLREKNLIGKAMSGKESPYGNMEAGALKRLYAALAEDQLENVSRIGGQDLRDQLRFANQLYTKKAALEKRIINSFGKEGEGSIATLMQRSIKSGEKGDATAFNKLLKVIPEDLQKEVVSSALMANSIAKGGALKGQFGFSEFATAYDGIRRNTPIYNAMIKSMGGEDAHVLLSGLYQVSKRLTDARAATTGTGASLQAFRAPETLIGKVVKQAAGRMAVVGAGAAGAGPVGAIITSGIVDALKSGQGNAINAAGKLLNSSEFKELAREAATKPFVPKKSIRQVVLSPAFKKYALAVKLPKDRLSQEQWVTTALQTQKGENNVPN